MNNSTGGAVTTGIDVRVAAGGMTRAIDLSDSDIVTALAIGANAIRGAGRLMA